MIIVDGFGLNPYQPTEGDLRIVIPAPRPRDLAMDGDAIMALDFARQGLPGDGLALRPF